MKINEILVLHHSHLDVGYTHTQPVLMELQREFLDEALRLLDHTADWADENSKPRWTIEVTAQLQKWLETVSGKDLQKFTEYAQAGRIGVSGMQYNSTPLTDAAGLATQLAPIRNIREQFGIPITTVNQHDVNGIPWPFVDIAKDAGIKLLIMAVNIHFGGSIDNRPSLFNWKGPSGRTIKVMNGAHYTMFDQLLTTWEDNLDTMAKGFADYEVHLEKRGWPHDFVYLTTAAAPVCWDNSPPNFSVAKLIRSWNAEGRSPRIRYVTPDQLRQRIDQVPESKIHTLEGDWTDFWNFGAASTAHALKISRNTKRRLQTSRLLGAARTETEAHTTRLDQKAQDILNLFDEHTWGAFNTKQHSHPFSRSQAHIKTNLPYEAEGLSEYLIVDELEALAGNDWDMNTQAGVLVVNPAGIPRAVPVPVNEFWPMEGKRLRTARMAWPTRYGNLEGAPLHGPIKLPPYSWKFLKFDDLELMPETNPELSTGLLTEAVPVQRLNINEKEVVTTATGFLESPSHRIEYDTGTGRITRVFDKQLNWEVLPHSSEFTFFQIVREEPDPLINSHRTAMYARNVELEKFDFSGWQTDWKARRQPALRPISNRVETGPDHITLVLNFEMPGLSRLEQRISLRSDTSIIELTLDVDKQDIQNPESYYLTFPLSMDANWRGYFDSAGVPFELDKQQLPDVSRDWVTVDSFASISHEDQGRSAQLYCPDAPLVMHGDFNFGKRSSKVEKVENPLLLAWPFNNYWDTNFPASQAGKITLRYGFSTSNNQTLSETSNQGHAFCQPSEIHPALKTPDQSEGSFIELSGEDWVLLEMRKAKTDSGIFLTLVNSGQSREAQTIRVPGKIIKSAQMSNALEEPRGKLDGIKGDTLSLILDPGKITFIHLKTESN